MTWRSYLCRVSLIVSLALLSPRLTMAGEPPAAPSTPGFHLAIVAGT